MTFLPKNAALLGLAFILSASSALAQEQTVPFDMSGERPAVETKPAAGDDKPVTTQTKQPEQKVATPDTSARRYIIPASSLRLEGEIDSRSFPVFLTKQQATSTASISLGYSSAVVVAPESSKLTVIVNDVTVGEVPVQSPEGTKDIRFDLRIEENDALAGDVCGEDRGRAIGRDAGDDDRRITLLRVYGDDQHREIHEWV